MIEFVVSKTGDMVDHAGPFCLSDALEYIKDELGRDYDDLDQEQPYWVWMNQETFDLSFASVYSEYKNFLWWLLETDNLHNDGFTVAVSWNGLQSLTLWTVDGLKDFLGEDIYEKEMRYANL